MFGKRGGGPVRADGGGEKKRQTMARSDLTMEESVIKIESRDENSSGSLYGNVSVEFSSVQPRWRAPLRDTFDNCTQLYFVFARNVTNIRKK